MTRLRRRRQVFARTETAPGTAQTVLDQSDYNIPNVRNVSWRISPLQVARDFNKNTLTKHPKLVPGQTVVEISFECEVGGDPDNPQDPYDAPPWERVLNCCGLDTVGLRQFEIGAITSGPFHHGETVSQATSGADLTMHGDLYTGRSRLYAEEDTGTPNGTGALTGDTSGASCTPTSIAANTIGGWKLTSDVDANNTATVWLYVDGSILKVKGCRGTADFNFSHGNPCFIAFTLTGVFTDWLDGALSTNTTTQLTPPAFFDVDLSVNDGTLEWDDALAGGTSGVLNTMTISLGNQVAPRENTLSSTGVDFAYIVDRAPTMSFNPDMVDETDYKWVQSLVDGAKQYAYLDMGTVAGNIFEFIMPGIQFADLSDDEREGVDVAGITCDLTGADYGDPGAGTAGQAGVENELTIVYR